MNFMKPPCYRLAAIIAIASLASCAWLFLTPSGRKLCCSNVYKTFVSPDERFQVAVFRIGTPWRMFPGSVGDAPGFIRLQTWDGRVLHEQEIEAVQLVEQIRWSATSADIPLIAEWPLPADVAVPAGTHEK
ncbi:hypothetical protein M5C97_07160 [Acidovorax sp. NCPPB 3859]|nr:MULTISPECIES: hypothetical protein [unclassified Acidovorax]MDA8451931.1 hypothetical protein [Acidovorax sp. GBBC 3297]MDA8461377.1 hypothetical protein [Acidovorax sp. GBBC 3333]MDA8466410.1 hypothetical protein [Acidovorax sp. GBBC 3332]MDA8471446.1 hypothetical protein [Acidovorax sp. GBBC 3299]WCM80076.1 hypothetical protein M5C94_07155 [Acidovorax sp. GBBC 712]